MARSRLTVWALVLLALIVGTASPAFAQTSDPWDVAQQVRRELFTAQQGLSDGDQERAQVAIDAAAERYEQELRQQIGAASPRAAAAIATALATSRRAGDARDGRALALARGQLWAGLLHGSSAVVLQAVERGDGTTASSWLLLREFRTATKFSRPGADATLAVSALLAGQGSTAETLAAVRADLYDTYQARLNEILADADAAQRQGFATRRAEQVGLALGYFELLSEAYGIQRGEAALAQGRGAFAGLAQAALADDNGAFQQARAEIDRVLGGFRAAPLSPEDQARRAGQLLRFIGLVPIEYGRGVRNGVVLKDIEVQEAVTFRAAAAAAFADLQPSLDGRDLAATKQVADLLQELDSQIRNTADPSAVEASVSEINRLLGTLLPPEWQQLNAASDFDVIASVLDQVETAVAQGQYELAESARLEAYAVLDSGPEQKLRAFAPDQASHIETLFWQGEADQPGLAVLLANRAKPAEIKTLRVSLDGALAEGQAALNMGKNATVAVAGNAAIIVFREGLEAVLILASILGSLRTIETRKHRQPLVVGSILAFVGTVITWWIARTVLTSLSQYGERLEAIVSLIAIGVLLLITNWFFHKVYWTGWMAGFHSKKRQLIGGAAGQWLGLVVLGFTSIYREGFETVLFLQALVLDAGVLVVLQGVALGLVGVAAVGALTFVLQAKLPYKKMLIVTGVMIGAVLLMMVGTTVHVMQAVGWLSLTPVQGLYLPYWMGLWFGLFATWESVGLQVATAVFVIGSYFWAEYVNHRKAAGGGHGVAQGVTR